MPAEHFRESLFVDQLEDYLNNHLNTPFFLWMSFPLPHPKMYPPEPYFSKYKDKELSAFPEWPVPTEVIDTLEDDVKNRIERKELDSLTQEMVHNGVRSYYACVEFMDSQIGRVLDLLDKYNLSDDTVVVYTSDHGEMLGHNGLFGKSTFYEPASHVPCVIRAPGDIEPSTVIEKCTGSVDLLPTLFDFANVPIPETVNGKPVDGISIKTLLQGQEKEWVDQVFIERKLPRCMVRSGYWKYIHTKDNDDRLYNLQLDPQERINFIDDPLFQDVKNDLYQRLKDKFGIETNVENSGLNLADFRLDQNYPNPFNYNTTIRFYLPITCTVILDLYNITGQKVATIINDALSAGEHAIQYDGRHLPSGFYSYKMRTGRFESVRWMQMVK
jgi:choline-sulfatase